MTTMMDTELQLERLDVFGQSWKGRRVTVVGLGRSGVAAARLLCDVGACVRATDVHDTPALQTVRDALLHAGVEHIELGGHTRESLAASDLMVVSPGVSESTGPVQWALEQRVPIISEIELAYMFCPCPIIAVTGTNGKSTTVSLITELLRTAGRSAVACGNLGIPFSSVIDQLTPDAIAVVEVSSFQLLWCEQFRPHIGVLLNIGTNHLDRHLDHSAYLAAKARLFQRQTTADWAVLNGRDERIVALCDQLFAPCVWFGENHSNPPSCYLAPETQRSLTDNAQAVLQVARLMGIPDPLTSQVMRSFRGLEHRMEHVATIHGIHFVNDSKSTTPDSCLFALAQLSGDAVVILGGRDKGLDFRALVERLHDPHVKGVILYGESRSQLRPLFNGSTTVRESHTLEAAVTTATAFAAPGTTVLFSPACASFDMFRDFEDRGRAFKTIVQRLAEHPTPSTGELR